MTTRADIAAALSTITGVSGSEYRPSVLGSGVAWAQMAAWDRDAGQAFIRTWNIFIVLPADERQAAQWLDANLDAVADALRADVFVDRVEPVTLPADSGSLFAALITARSE